MVRNINSENSSFESSFLTGARFFVTLVALFIVGIIPESYILLKIDIAHFY